MLSADLALKQQMATKQSREVTIWEGFWVNDSSIICRLSLLMIFERDCGVEFGIYGQYLTCTIYINLAGFCSGKFICLFAEGATSSLDEKNLVLGFFPPFHLFSFSLVGYLGHNPQFVLYSYLLWEWLWYHRLWFINIYYEHVGKKWTMKKNISQKCVIFLACSGGRGFSAWQIIADFLFLPTLLIWTLSEKDSIPFFLDSAFWRDRSATFE